MRKYSEPPYDLNEMIAVFRGICRALKYTFTFNIYQNKSKQEIRMDKSFLSFVVLCCDILNTENISSIH